MVRRSSLFTAFCLAATAVVLGAGLASAATPGLPDGRGYELVSPVNNADGDVYEPTLVGINGDGGHGYNTERPFQAASSGNAVVYVGDPSAQGGTGSEGQGAGNEYLAIRRSEGGWASANIEPLSAARAEQPVFQAFTSDLSAGIVDWNGQDPLVPGAPGGGYHVPYLRTSANGAYEPLFTVVPNRTPAEFTLHFVGGSANYEHLLFAVNDALVAPAEEDPPNAGENDLYDSVDGHLSLVNVLSDGKADPNATFGAGPSALSRPISTDGAGIFWTDLNSGRLYVRESDETTIPVSTGAAHYWTATPDGRYAFYTESEKLFRFDVESQARVELAGADVQSVLAVNEAGEDGSDLYYVASNDLYLLHQGESPRLIGSLTETEPTAEATPDGNDLLLADGLNLELYDSQSDTLTCIACGQSAILQPSNRDTYLPRWISQDGSRVFFDSADALVPQDTNGKLDVYEWERQGAGSCTQTEGCVFLLSGGASTDNSYFVDASSSGSDVFMVTREQFAPQDENESLDLYDVRVGAPSPPPVSPVCSGNGCQGVPSAPIDIITPASATFEGLGNLLAPAPPIQPPVIKQAKHGKSKSKAKRKKQQTGHRRPKGHPKARKRGKR